MKVFVMYNGLADDFPREAMAKTGSPFDPKDCVSIPTMTVLIDHEDGLILYDTGWTRRQKLTFELPESMYVENTMARIGYEPKDVNRLILSHLHLDHAGNIEAFPQAEISVSKNEFDNVASLLLQNKLAGTSYVEADVRAWSNQDINWNLIDSEYEVLPFAKGVSLVTLGVGHAYGILALLLELEKTGNVLIASDAIYSSVNVGPPVLPPGVIMDEAGWLRSYKYIREVAEKYEAKIWYGHDLEQFEGLIKADEGYYE